MFLNIRWCWHASRLEKMLKKGLIDTDEYKCRKEKLRKINKRLHAKYEKKRMKAFIKGDRA